MPPRGEIRWKKLEKHLKVLLPGFSYRISHHSRIVSYRDQRYALSRGQHGRKDPEIQLGQVKKMFVHFGKLEEAKARIPQLR